MKRKKRWVDNNTKKENDRQEKEIYMMTEDIFNVFRVNRIKKTICWFIYIYVFIWRRSATTMKVNERKIKENNLYIEEKKKNRRTNPSNNTNGYFS
jgi:hypothetical protein